MRTEQHTPTPTTRGRAGRPWSIDGRKLGEILNLIRAGASFDLAARGAGVSAEAFRLYRRRHPTAQAEAEAARTACINSGHRRRRAMLAAFVGV